MSRHNDCFGLHTHAGIISRSIGSFVGSMQLLGHRCLELCRFAGPNALVPRVTKLCVTGTSAVSEPRPSTAATAEFAGFPHDAALGAYSIYGDCRNCVFVSNKWSIVHERKVQGNSLSSGSKHACIAVDLGLTFAGLHALDPTVSHVSVTGCPTILIPSATRSTTTDSSGFLEHAAVWTR